MLHVLLTQHILLLRGFITTLSLLSMITLIGVPLGTLLGIIGGRFDPRVRRGIEYIRFFTRVVPALVILFWLHYPLQGILKIVIDPFWTSVLALSLIHTTVIAAIISSELGLLPKSYREAGITLGLTSWEVVRHIELPILMRRIFPQLLLQTAIMLEYTLFTSLISVPELFRTAQTINAMLYQPVPIYSLLVLFFCIILVPLHLCARYMTKKYQHIYA